MMISVAKTVCTNYDVCIGENILTLILESSNSTFHYKYLNYTRVTYISQFMVGFPSDLATRNHELVQNMLHMPRLLTVKWTVHLITILKQCLTVFLYRRSKARMQLDWFERWWIPCRYLVIRGSLSQKLLSDNSPPQPPHSPGSAPAKSTLPQTRKQETEHPIKLCCPAKFPERYPGMLQMINYWSSQILYCSLSRFCIIYKGNIEVAWAS